MDVRNATEGGVTMATTGGSYEDRPAGGAAKRMGVAGRTAWFPARQDYTSETKPFYLTSEFLVFALYLMGLAIAASTSPSIDARLFWILATVAVVGYMLSRGIAKAATRSRAHDPREDIDPGRD
jgi:predicted cobalt transporter CbtA